MIVVAVADVMMTEEVVEATVVIEWAAMTTGTEIGTVIATKFVVQEAVAVARRGLEKAVMGAEKVVERGEAMVLANVVVVASDERAAVDQEVLDRQFVTTMIPASDLDHHEIVLARDNDRHQGHLKSKQISL